MVSKEQVRELIGDYSADRFVRVLKMACAPASFISVGNDYRFRDVSDEPIRVLGVVGNLPGENGLPAPLLVADVPLSTVLTERSSRIRQFKLAKKVLEHFAATPPMELDGVIAQGVFVFHDADGRFRVSLVTATPENGRFNWSKARRQSFYVTNDPDANATFVQRMCMNWGTLKGIKDAFSVEKLTKEFYNQLFAWYERVCDDERVEYPNGLDTDADNREDKNRKHIIRLITRLMFVWFLKQKKLVPDSLFDEAELKRILKDFNPVGRKQHQYYRAILQNLFFATLNSEVEERGFAESPNPRPSDGKVMSRHHGVKTKYRYADEFAISRQKILDLFRPIPFLNGGLFECLDQENADGKVMYYDGFSLQERHRDLGTLTWAHVPNDLFFDPDYGIIPLLRRYNFTVEENSPGDEDVALDPELLGKVFENLLGAFNPETQEIARNTTGSFYTPREIVNYMVDESLIAYLTTAVGDCVATKNTKGTKAGGAQLVAPAKTDAMNCVPPESSIRSLVTDGVRPTDDALCARLAQSIEKAKILDPACGSGAFPMGALLKMVELLRVLKKLPEDINLYDLKLKLIENCIFGSDIQEIAVQISKLRIFISLVCEQKPDMSKSNCGINPLPNLETKFVAANSLIAIKKRKVETKDGETGQNLSYVDLFEAPGIQEAKDKLREIRHKHFAAKTRAEKNALRKEDKVWREKLAKLLVTSEGIDVADAHQLASWDPYNQNVHAEFFDPEWMFNVKEGFDIVIGNPPYIQLQENHGELANLYAPCGFKTFVRTGDIYCLFYEKGWQILQEGGILCYITSNKWLRGGYGESLRRFFIENTKLRHLLDFAGEKIFESASVDTGILLFTKPIGACITKDRVLNKSQTCLACMATPECRDGIECFFAKHARHMEFCVDDLWRVMSEREEKVFEKIRDQGKLLEEWDLQVNRGVLTGFNEAFIVDGDTRRKIVSEDRHSGELLLPYIKGQHVNRFSHAPSGKWLVATHNGYEDVPRIDVKRYPAIKRWLDSCEPGLSDRTDQGDTPYNLRSCAYWGDFSKPKILWAETMRIRRTSQERFPRFTYVEDGLVVDKTCFFATGKHLKYLVGVLNSTVGWYLCRQYVSILDNGGYMMQKAFVEKIPVLQAPRDQQHNIIVLVDRILAAKKRNPAADTSALEREIDEKVYRLYGLTDDEIRVIEGTNGDGDVEEGNGVRGATALPNNHRDGATLPSAPKSGSVKKKRKPKFEEEF